MTETITIDGEKIEAWKPFALWRVLGNPEQMLREAGELDEPPIEERS